MNYFVYILESEINSRFYIGQTNDVADRLKRHNRGESTSTKPYCPWKLKWSMQVNSRSEAMKLEKKLKNFKSRERILEFIDTTESSRSSPVTPEA